MLTAKQKQVLDFIIEYKDKNGTTPTQQEVCNNLGIKSVSTAHQHVHRLVQKGYLKQADNYAEIEIVTKPKDTSNYVPIIGSIAAGAPIIATEDDTATSVHVPNLPERGEFYALRVQGDSMIDEGILDGDTVVIKKQSSAENGQTVVAIIDENMATLKKLYKTKGGYKLQPANQALLPLFRKEVEVRGIVWEIRRSFDNSQRIPTKKRAGGRKWKTLDLFAGVGGIRLGFENTGKFETVWANDFEQACSFTYDANFKNSKLTVADITKIHAKDLPNFDFLLAGFPCQAFSIAGYRHGFDDEKGRGNLFVDIARILKEKQPKGFLLENVKNLRTHDNGKTFTIIKKALEDLDYTIKDKVMNSMEYGNVPQNRERIYIVGFKDSKLTEKFKFPEPTPLKKKIADILESDVDEKYYYNGKPLYEKVKNDINEEGQVYQWRRKYVRRNKKGVSPTLTANMGMGGHNVPIIYDRKGIRKLTPRECARIQGFPESFKLPDIADSKLYKQIGNSVSVPVIERIARQMIRAL